MGAKLSWAPNLVEMLTDPVVQLLECVNATLLSLFTLIHAPCSTWHLTNSLLFERLCYLYLRFVISQKKHVNAKFNQHIIYTPSLSAIYHIWNPFFPAPTILGLIFTFGEPFFYMPFCVSPLPTLSDFLLTTTAFLSCLYLAHSNL